MLRPVIAIVGCPNVGKSTLFNRLVGRRQALVRDIPGVTRDRLSGVVSFERWQATVVDTGGFDPTAESDIPALVKRQVLMAIEEADLLLFVVDGRAGLTALDEEVARIVRRSHRPVVLVVSKVEGPSAAPLAEFYRLGFSHMHALSAEHGRGVAELLEDVRALAPPPSVEADAGGLRVAVVGRPNVGKSSLINAILGAERVLVHEAPGTTRDSVDTPLLYRDRTYVLIDTAGIRRKGRVTAPLEKLAVVMARRSLERCQVAILLLDASEGLASQDAHIAGYAHRAGRALVIAVNKWDLAPRGPDRRAQVVSEIRDRFPFLDYAPVTFTSALTRAGIPELFDLIDRVGEEASKKIPPALATKVVIAAVERRPMTFGGVPLKVHSAAQIGLSPPTFVLRVNLPDRIHFSYERYLVNLIRQAFGFTGSPIRLTFAKARARGVRP